MTDPKVVSAPPCPFWRAAATDQSQVDPAAPKALEAGEKNHISDAIEHLMYHAGFPRAKATAVAELLIVAANKTAKAKLSGLLAQTYTLNELSGGILDKELDSGLLRRVDEDGTEHVGEFSEENMAKLFSDKYASDVMVNGKMQRCLTKAQLGAFVEDKREALKANAVHNLMAELEMTELLIGLFGRDADDGQRVLTQRDVEIFYREGIFPHQRLDAEVAKAYPLE